MRTFTFMFLNFLGGIVLNLSFLSWVNGHDWEWAYKFPIGWGGAGLNAMATFFHEIGHTIPAWFYGYVTLPSFDFTYGGGMAWMLGSQILPLALFFSAALVYGLFHFREERGIQFLIAVVLIFQLATLFTGWHEAVIDFAGPAFEVLIASFFLYRAWLDKAPERKGERTLNALIGWGLMIRVYILGTNLLHNDAMREHYYTQKGSHGFGDFDKVADRLSMNFESVVLLWLGLAALFTLIPFILFLAAGSDEDEQAA